MPAGAALFRVHSAARAPLWFGPAPGDPPRNRFDDPERATAGAGASFGVCYLGLSREAAFAESFLHPRVHVLSRATVDARAITWVATTRPLQLVALHGPGLAAVGATAAVTHGPHATARRWARALWRHPAQPDGLAYRCRHDDDELAVALFDRAADALTEVACLSLRDDLPWFGRTLDRYRLALEE